MIFVFGFGFEDILKNQPVRGSLAARIKVLGVLHHIFHFVSLTLTPFLIFLLIIIDINLILIDLRVVLSS